MLKLVDTSSLILLVSFAIILSLLLNLIIAKLYAKNGFFDQINERSSHKNLATRTGGVAIFNSLTIITLLLYWKDFQIFDFSILLPISIIVLIGVYDDLYNMDFKFKLLFTFILAKILIDQGFVLQSFYLFNGQYEPNYFIAQIITGITLVGVINSINLMDGIDGLSSGFCFLVLNLINVMFRDFELYFFNLIVLGLLFPQLILNFKNHNKVFLGDSGSLFLGTILAINFFTIIKPTTVFNFDIDPNKILFSWLVLFFPLADLLRLFYQRTKKRLNPFSPDKNHLHHIIINRGYSHIKATLMVLGATVTNVLFGFIFWKIADEVGLLFYLLSSTFLYVFYFQKNLFTRS